MKKNDIIELKIESLTNEGCGLGRYEGMVVFVPMSAAGDLLRVRLLKVNKSHSYGKIEEILSPSPDRIESDCPVFGKCGGCSFRHISYDAELRAKEGFVRDAFTRIGGLSPDFLPIIGNASPDGYRNKAQYPVGKNADGEYISGFYADRSHRIIPCESCRLEQAVFSEIRAFILEYCRKKKIAVYNEEEHKGVLRAATAIKPNRPEASLLTGVDIRTHEDLPKAAQAFFEKGVKNVFISLGGEGVYFDDGQDRGILPIIPGPIRNTNGCGDAFLAAAADGYLMGLSVRQIALRGLAASSLCARSESAVSPHMCTETIDSILD